MLDLSFQQLLLRAGGVLLVSLVHGLALVLLARAMGDRGPQYDGRLTANPFQHLDVVGAAALILFSYGWVRPVEFDERATVYQRLLLIIGSLVASLLVALALQIATPPAISRLLPGPTGSTIQVFVRDFSRMTAGLVALNLIPIRPLTGGLLTRAFSPSADDWLRRHQTVVSVALLVLIVLGATGAALDPLRGALTRLLLAS